MPDTGLPDNWTWADGPVAAGPCVLVDVDGVIANGWHRQHFLQGNKWDWKGFFAEAADDVPMGGAVALLEAFDPNVVVILLTARPDSIHQVTVDWVREHGFRFDLLVMRGRKDSNISSPDFKRQSVVEIRAAGFVPTLAIDDDKRNIEMFRDEGIASLYLHSGYYEA